MAELSDKEITEACARVAMCVPISAPPHVKFDGGIYVMHISKRCFVYNPLQDDAQAMALVKKLRLFIGGNHDVNAYKWLVFPAALVGIKQIEAWDTDLNRAICLCAARVQIEKEKNANG